MLGVVMILRLMSAERGWRHEFNNHISGLDTAYRRRRRGVLAAVGKGMVIRDSRRERKRAPIHRQNV